MTTKVNQTDEEKIKNREQKRIQEDLEFIGKTMEWPHWPFLPVKNYKINKENNWPECGIIIDAGTTRFSVYIVNLFALSSKYGSAFKLSDLVDDKSVKRYSYNNYKEMLEAGWMVD